MSFYIIRSYFGVSNPRNPSCGRLRSEWSSLRVWRARWAENDHCNCDLAYLPKMRSPPSSVARTCRSLSGPLVLL